MITHDPGRYIQSRYRSTEYTAQAPSVNTSISRAYSSFASPVASMETPQCDIYRRRISLPDKVMLIIYIGGEFIYSITGLSFHTSPLCGPGEEHVYCRG